MTGYQWHDIPCDTCHCPMWATSMSDTCRDCTDYHQSPYYAGRTKSHAFMYAPSTTSMGGEFCRVCGKPRDSTLHNGQTVSQQDIYETTYEGNRT